MPEFFGGDVVCNTGPIIALSRAGRFTTKAKDTKGTVEVGFTAAA